MLKSKIFLNIFIDSLFFFTKNFPLKDFFFDNFNLFTNNLIIVKRNKVLQYLNSKLQSS
jgi:hypothetical protein